MSAYAAEFETIRAIRRDRLATGWKKHLCYTSKWRQTVSDGKLTLVCTKCSFTTTVLLEVKK